MSGDDILTLPTLDELGKLDVKDLADRISTLIDHAERGSAVNQRGGIELAMFRVQYLTQELVRRDQAKQTESMIAQAEAVKVYTIAIGIMTVVIMLVTVWSVVHH